MKRPELKHYQTKAFHHFDMESYAKDLNNYIDYLEQETKAGNLPISDVSNRAIEFGKWLQGGTPFKPTANNDEWKALHMSDGWQLKTTEELYSDFCKEHGY